MDFFDISQSKNATFSQKRVVSDADGNFQNSVSFGSQGTYVIEVFNSLSPNIYASTAIFIENGASVIVNSPVSADVYFNGSLVGKTPANLANLKYGNYEILCRAPNYKDYKTYFSVSLGTGNELKALPSRDAILCANEKIYNSSSVEKTSGKNFFQKLMEAIKEFFRILFSRD